MLTFQQTEIADVVIVETRPVVDDRGEFIRSYCRNEFAERGLAFVPVQISLSWNHRQGTLRGLHYQAPPRAEAKLVSCTRGSVFDVAVDLREESPTYARWTAVELRAPGRRALFIPPGCAHGFQTLEDETELLYLISEEYEPRLQRGVRWDDPDLAISWPDAPKRLISNRDRELPPLRGGTR